MANLIIVSVPDYGELILNFKKFNQKYNINPVSVPDYGELILNIR